MLELLRMTNRSIPFTVGEYYHCFNRGVDKRDIFLDAEDFHYFQTALELFNQLPSRGDMVHYKCRHRDRHEDPLVSIVAYSLLPNHFHILLRQEVDGGITKFMRKLGTGYTMYFNKKYNRSGSLFQGQFKSVHISDDIQLRHLFAYVSNNRKVHALSDKKKFRDSYQEVVEKRKSKICNLNLVNNLFENNLQQIIDSGIKHTITYRKSLGQSEKSELLEYHNTNVEV